MVQCILNALSSINKSLKLTTTAAKRILITTLKPQS